MLPLTKFPKITFILYIFILKYSVNFFLIHLKEQRIIWADEWFIILIAVMESQVYTYVKTYQFLKYMQFI